VSNRRAELATGLVTEHNVAIAIVAGGHDFGGRDMFEAEQVELLGCPYLLDVRLFGNGMLPVPVVFVPALFGPRSTSLVVRNLDATAGQLNEIAGM